MAEPLAPRTASVRMAAAFAQARLETSSGKVQRARAAQPMPID